MGGQDLQDLIDIRLRVVGIDLEADLLVALGHDRVRQSGGQDSVRIEVGHQVPGLGRVPDHEGHHRVLPRDDLEAQILQPVLELPGKSPEPVQELLALGAVQDLEGLQGRGRLRCGDGIGVDVEGGGLTKEGDETFSLILKQMAEK